VHTVSLRRPVYRHLLRLSPVAQARPKGLADTSSTDGGGGGGHRDWAQVQLDAVRSFVRSSSCASLRRWVVGLSLVYAERTHLFALPSIPHAGALARDAVPAAGASLTWLPQPAPVAPLLPGAPMAHGPSVLPRVDQQRRWQGFGDVCSVFLLMFGPDDAAAVVDRVATTVLRYAVPCAPASVVGSPCP
jgi:hypothetical protein